MDVTIQGHIRTTRWLDIHGDFWIQQEVYLQYGQVIRVNTYGPINLKTIAVTRTGEGDVMLMSQPISLHSSTERPVTDDDRELYRIDAADA